MTLVLVSGATRTVAALRYTPAGARLGRLLRPGNGNLPDELPWACDNGAFAGFEEQPFLHLLHRLRGRPGCLWVAAPDVVADARATAALYDVWEPRIRSLGFPVALVAQDGLRLSDVPWARVDALFVGGSTRWKLGSDACALVMEAHARGVRTHMGRVNTHRRLRLAMDWRIGSVDGTNFSRFPDAKLPGFLSALQRLSAQGTLPGVL